MERKSGPVLLAVIVILMCLSYFIPYTWLSDVDAWYGSFLLWVLFTVVVIGINVIVSLRWRD